MASWLDGLRELRAFADVWASPGTWNGEAYEFKVRLNFNAAALEKRFFEGYVPPASAATDAQADSDDEEEEVESSDDTTTAPDEAPIDGEEQP